jgi:predicted lysophospholipase L1 biosynthesis ABC-type transport system permease subunit
VAGPAADAVRDDRRHFLPSRRRVLAATSVTVAALAALAVLLLAPNRLASLRLGEVALAWWVAGAAAAGGLRTSPERHRRGPARLRSRGASARMDRHRHGQ